MTEGIRLQLHFNAPLPWHVIKATYEPGEDFQRVHLYAAFENSTEAKEYMEALLRRLEKLPR